MRLDREKAIIGCLLGTAVGDALGLPYEGLSPRRATRMLGLPDRHRFLFGRGMLSDDTEHTILVAQAWMQSPDSADRFARILARRLRRWFLALPAGIGMATAKACMKLCLGFPYSRSGVWSAGNGPAMRSAILGVLLDDRNQLEDYVAQNSKITHTDPKARWGAFAISLASKYFVSNQALSPESYLEELTISLRDNAGEFLALVREVLASVERREFTREFSHELCGKNGVSGSVMQTIPICLHACFSYPDDYESAVSAVIECGGDADSTAAIVGGIIGARVGIAGIPDSWLKGVSDWPYSITWLRNLGREAAKKCAGEESDHFLDATWIGCFIRNLFFLCVVLTHGVRRIFPPY